MPTEAPSTAPESTVPAVAPSPPRSVWRRAWDMSFGWVGRLVYERILRPVLGINDSPHSIALGTTLGVFVALTPTVGVQMPIVFLLCSIARGNRVAGLAMCWISNPVTTLPMYYGYYRLGLGILGGEAVGYEDVKRILDPGEDASFWTAFIDLIEQLGWPLWLGSLIVAVVFTAPTYPLSRRYFGRRAARRARREETT
ncbi:MAG: DUF2062 domain-containing protein [Planctomycetota bacterium]